MPLSVYEFAASQGAIFQKKFDQDYWYDELLHLEKKAGYTKKSSGFCCGLVKAYIESGCEFSQIEVALSNKAGKSEIVRLQCQPGNQIAKFSPRYQFIGSTSGIVGSQEFYQSFMRLHECSVYLAAIADIPGNTTGHAIALSFETDCIKLFDPNFGEFKLFFLDKFDRKAVHEKALILIEYFLNHIRHGVNVSRRFDVLCFRKHEASDDQHDQKLFGLEAGRLLQKFHASMLPEIKFDVPSSYPSGHVLNTYSFLSPSCINRGGILLRAYSYMHFSPYQRSFPAKFHQGLTGVADNASALVDFSQAKNPLGIVLTAMKHFSSMKNHVNIEKLNPILDEWKLPDEPSVNRALLVIENREYDQLYAVAIVKEASGFSMHMPGQGTLLFPEKIYSHMLIVFLKEVIFNTFSCANSALNVYCILYETQQSHKATNWASKLKEKIAAVQNPVEQGSAVTPTTN